MNVLSLFNGMGCIWVALDKLGIQVDRRYVSEIDKYANIVNDANYPDTIHLGDVTQVDSSGLDLDLIVGGSPCQGFSFAGKQLNFDDPRSMLFFEFVRIRNQNPKALFLLENVKMKKEYQDVISGYLGVEPIEINSALVSAQNRKRLYWTNIPGVTQPEDKGIKLEDILEHTEFIGPGAIRGRRLNKATILGRRLDDRGKRQDYDKTIPITQCLEVRATNTDKSNCLTTVAKDTVLTPMPIGRHPDAFNRKLPYRNYTKIERCRLMNLPDNYCDEVSLNQTVKLTGNGWTVDVIAHILKDIELL